MDTRVVTVSAPYGTAGRVIGSAVAEQLGWTFLDRAIPYAIARSLAVPMADVLKHDERAETRIQRILAALAAADLPVTDNDGVLLNEHAYVEETERLIREAADRGQCVILGRGAVMVLRDEPTVLHVCLRGPFDRRVALAAIRSTDDKESVRHFVRDSDHTRDVYFRRFYRVDPDDPELYHLMIDSTTFRPAACTDLIAAAARCGMQSTEHS